MARLSFDSATATDRLLITGRAANPGLEATLDGQPLEPVTVDAATQAFRVPAGAGGAVTLGFAADGAYRGLLLGGGVLAALTVLAAGGVLARTRRLTEKVGDEGASISVVSLGLATALLVAGWPGLAAAAVTLLVLRVTLIPAGLLAFSLVGVAGAWLARGPWPVGDYAGDSTVLALLLVAALTSLLPGSSRKT